MLKKFDIKYFQPMTDKFVQGVPLALYYNTVVIWEIRKLSDYLRELTLLNAKGGTVKIATS